jgi:iron complex outermembrane receptor protein
VCALLAASAASAQAPVTVPPSVIAKVDALYPPDAAPAAHDLTVVVRVTVEPDGSVASPEVMASGGAAFDAAAVAAVRQWRFHPALQGETPVASRIRIPFLFVAPTPAPGADAGAAEPVAVAADAGVALLPEVMATAPVAPPPSPPDAGEGVIDVTVLGRARTPSRGASDYQIETAQLAQVPHPNAADYLKLAPSVLLTNEGGEGHAEQVFMRGFDAREGQDIEFSVDGVPINESGNLHGNGYSDTHFIIPELIESLRVVEGPFDPRQGNYAVAGSADFHLGLADRGMVAKLAYGSFNTQRLFLAYGPPGTTSGTFAAGELFKTDGYGQDRDGQRASVMAQYEGHLGTSLFRVAAQGMTSSFRSAGLIREDDYQSGRIGFYDSYDTLDSAVVKQGEDSSRYSLSASLESHGERVTFNNQVFAIYRPLRILENFTGFLLDIQEPVQSPHGQRGDLIDLYNAGTTLGAKGSGRLTGHFLGQKQELELGYFARHDIVSSLQQRIENSTGAPYLTEFNLDSNLDDIGLYADGNLRVTRWLVLRGGGRADLFTFHVHNLCAVGPTTVEHPLPSNPPGDASCISQENFGQHREPDQAVSANGSAVLPRVSLILGPWWGLSATASAGTGVRSMDPLYVAQGKATPFVSIDAYEAGLTFERRLGSAARLAASSTLFDTHVSQDLFFSPTAGLNVLAGGTTRLGTANAVRLTGSFFDVNLNATYVRATLDQDGSPIPYVPNTVLREDGSVFYDFTWDALRLDGALPRATLGLGTTYVAKRPLPYATFSDPIFTMDTNLVLGWPLVSVGLSVTNLLNAHYELGEYNFQSDFHTQVEPTLVPVRMFSAGAPRQLMLTLTLHAGDAR